MKNQVSIILLMLTVFGVVNGDVIVLIQATDQIMEEFHSLSASFGPSLPPNGLRVLAVGASKPDIYGCKGIEPPPDNVTLYGERPKWVVLISRYNCTFEQKVRNAQRAGYDAVIVYNRNSNDLEVMSANDDSDIFIPSVFVGQTTGSVILDSYQFYEGFALSINDDLPFNINTHLIIPFCVVVGLCFVAMLGFMVARCIRERRRLLRYRLPNSSLKKLESRKFSNKNDLRYETCAICLDDYVEGDKLRILPCKHAYHAICIDPWLTKNRRVCPVCKRKVYIAGERSRRQRRRRSSTSDSITSYEADDQTPLINPSDPGSSSTNHGTFPESAPSASQQQQQDTDDEPIINQGMSDDDEMLGGNANPQNRRINPFDRVPNLPPNLVNTLYPVTDENLSKWQRFKRFFQIGQNAENVLNAEDVDVIIQPNTVNQAHPSSSLLTNTNVPTARRTSNNILNANLSGSFREQVIDESDEQLLANEADNDDDVEILTGDRKRKRNKRRNRSAANESINNNNYEEPSTSAQNRSIGVVALPNMNFNPSLPPPSTSRNNYI